MREELSVSNILLVDDTPANLLALEAVLEPLGHRLVKAHSGEEALRHLLREQFALVLLDVQMPGLDGFETARLIRLRAQHQRLPILFITALSHDEAHLREGYEQGQGPVDYILKPFDPDILRTKVSTFISLYHQTERPRQQGRVLRETGHTEQRRVHDQLLFQASILDNVQESIIVTDLAHRIVYWNRGATALFGYAAEEMLGKTPALLYPEQDLPAAAQDTAQILEGHDYCGEWRGRRKDGTLLWVDVKTRPMRDGNGQLTGLLGVATDVTSRKRADQKLRFLSEASRLMVEATDDTEALLQRIAQLAVDAIADSCVVDLVQEDGLLRRVTVAHREPLKEPLLRESLSFAAQPGSGSPVLEALRSGQRSLITDFTPLRKQAAQSDEHLRLLDILGVHSLLAVPLRGQHGPLGLINLGMCTPGQQFLDDDLEMAEELARRAAGALETRLLFRQAQQSLRRAETDKRIAETFARLGLAFASELDRDKLLQLITDEATGLTGAAFGAFFHQLDNEQGESYMLYTLSGVPREAFARFPMPRNTAIFGPTFVGKATVRMDDVTQAPEYGKNPPYRGMPEGHLPVKSYLAIPVKSRSGQILGGLFFGHPEPARFSEEHERLAQGLAAQAAVALDNSRLYQQAQLAISVRDEFLQVAAHELRTPTTSLKLNVQSLLRTANGLGPAVSVEKLHDKLESLDRLTGRLSGLVNTLLDISRVTAGSLQLKWEDVDLAEVAREVASRFEAQAAQMRAPVRLTASAPVVGHWDRLRLEQIITNLMSNALKYGAGKPVHLTVSATDTQALLIVRDEGIGISPEALSRIFGRFERAVSQRHYGGLGLGLYITRQVVEAMGGTIHVHSEVGQGATFTVRLPLAATPAAHPRQEPS